VLLLVVLPNILIVKALLTTLLASLCATDVYAASVYKIISFPSYSKQGIKFSDVLRNVIIIQVAWVYEL